ncbi:hypothetical protein [Mycobacterium ostraviense]|uniref:Uncharacterized protein n=1 Tax=Mycobacterium ostraviense TaxID=2738409 RepID=A0A163XBS3_9MYCO|nr:hypothetical protein [Mycobacterium ostraviense]KZS59209.1 hypothetical protein A4G28_02850 [Mycobacterium ostraviense]UGT93240.1 hypothetical protein LTS72_08080 [Mycobacterium ostraviense]
MFAAVYPETVSLAIIASPLWRQRASGDNSEQREFLADASRRLGTSATEDGPGHQAIIHWMLYDSHHPPSRPDKTFPDTRGHNSKRPAKPNSVSRRRTNRSAAWFNTQPLQRDPLPQTSDARHQAGMGTGNAGHQGHSHCQRLNHKFRPG